MFDHSDPSCVPAEVDFLAEDRPAYVATAPTGGAPGAAVAWILPALAPAFPAAAPPNGAAHGRGSRGDHRPRRAGGARRRPSSPHASGRGGAT